MNPQGRVYGGLLIAGAGILMLLPAVTTFDHLLAAWATLLGVDRPLEAVTGIEVRMAAGLLRAIGLAAAVDGGMLIVNGPSGLTAVQVTWNCVGWQSAVLLAVTFAAGLRDAHSLEARAEVVLGGVLGTVLVNLVRIAVVGVVASAFGEVPAVIVHDYGGTLLTIAWLFGLWAFSYRWILEPATLEFAE